MTNPPPTPPADRWEEEAMKALAEIGYEFKSDGEGVSINVPLPIDPVPILIAALRAEREATLEEAAKYHDGEAARWRDSLKDDDGGLVFSPQTVKNAISYHEQSAAAIRSLKSTPQGGGNG